LITLRKIWNKNLTKTYKGKYFRYFIGQNLKPFIMKLFEKKGLIQILIFFLENNNKIRSKYYLNHSIRLSKLTIKECIDILESNKLIKKFEKIGPRLRTEIQLTSRGVQIALKFKKIKSIIDNNHN